MKIYIYKIYFPLSDKCYIGQTQDLQKRMREHLCSGYLICKALYKYDDWQVSILHTCKTRDEAHKVEIEEIRNYNSVVPCGYNLTRGGEGTGGLKWSQESIDKMRASLPDRHGKNNNMYGTAGGFAGRLHSDETKKKMSKSQRGNKNGVGAKHPDRSEKNRIMNKNPQTILKQRIGRLANGIKKLEQELETK